MKGQQAVLNDILNRIAVMDLPAHDCPQYRKQIRQKRPIDDCVAGKRRLHAGGPIAMNVHDGVGTPNSSTNWYLFHA